MAAFSHPSAITSNVTFLERLWRHCLLSTQQLHISSSHQETPKGRVSSSLPEEAKTWAHGSNAANHFLFLRFKFEVRDDA